MTNNVLALSFFVLLQFNSMNEAVGQAHLTFYANISDTQSSQEKSWIGHVWIGLSDGKTEIVYGFYPEGLTSDSGRFHEVNYSFRITSAAYANVLKVIEEYQSASYIPGFRDCRAFAQSIAKAAGLNTPSVGLKSPAEWLGHLVDSN